MKILEQESGENIETFTELESNYGRHAVKFEPAADEWQRMTATVADQFGHLNDDRSMVINSISEQRGQFTESLALLRTEFSKPF